MYVYSSEGFDCIHLFISTSATRGVYIGNAGRLYRQRGVSISATWGAKSAVQGGYIGNLGVYIGNAVELHRQHGVNVDMGILECGCESRNGALRPLNHGWKLIFGCRAGRSPSGGHVPIKSSLETDPPSKIIFEAKPLQLNLIEYRSIHGRKRN